MIPFVRKPTRMIKSVTMSLDFRIRAPSTPDAPLLFLVHGRAGNKDVMWTFSRSVPEDWGIIAPQAPLNDPIGGFSWWLIDSLTRAEDIEHAAKTLRDFILQHSNPNHPRALIAAGFSQGAGLLSLLLQREPQLFKGVALLAGFVLKAPSVASAERARIFVGHGTLDKTVSIETALQGAERLRSQGFSVEFHQDPVGHKIGSATMRSLKQFFFSF